MEAATGTPGDGAGKDAWKEGGSECNTGGRENIYITNAHAQILTQYAIAITAVIDTIAKLSIATKRQRTGASTCKWHCTSLEPRWLHPHALRVS